MVHLVVGLFKNQKKAEAAIIELKTSKSSVDISLISKDKISGKIHIHQVKEMPGEEEIPGEIKGWKIGTIAGVLIGLFMITNPETASLGTVGIIAAAMGVIGGTIGTSTGMALGFLNKAGLPPERAKMYKDKIKKGEIFVSVSTLDKEDEEVINIFLKHSAVDVHTLNNIK